MKEWIKCSNQLPRKYLVVETKIEDETGTRNIQDLQRMNNLWFHPDGKMYVYYTPTHWRHKP